MPLQYSNILLIQRLCPCYSKGSRTRKEIAEGKVASEIIDIYEEPYEEKIVTVDIKS